MALGIKPYDVAEYLTDDAMISAYLAEAVEEDDASGISHSLNDVVRAYGFARLAQDSGIGYEELVHTLHKDEVPNLKKLVEIVRALDATIPQQKAA